MKNKRASALWWSNYVIYITSYTVYSIVQMSVLQLLSDTLYMLIKIHILTSTNNIRQADLSPSKALSQLAARQHQIILSAVSSSGSDGAAAVAAGSSGMAGTTLADPQTQIV